MKDYHLLFDVKEKQLIQLIYQELTDINDDIEQAYQETMANAKTASKITYKIQQLFDIICSLIFLLVYAFCGGTFISTLINTLVSQPVPFFVSVGKLIIDVKLLKDMVHPVLVQAIFGGGVAIGILLFVLMLLVGLKKPKDKKQNKQEDITLEKAYQILGVTEYDEWSYIQKQLISKMNYRNRKAYGRYVKAYITIFENYTFLENQEAGKASVNQMKTWMHTIKVVLKSLCEAIAPTAVMIPVLMLFIKSGFKNYLNFEGKAKSGATLKGFTFKAITHLSAFGTKVYDFSIKVQALLKKTPLGAINLDNDWELFIYMIIGIMFFIIIYDLVFKKVPYIMRDYHAYQRYQLLSSNNLNKGKYQSVDPYHNQFLVFMVFVIGLIVYVLLSKGVIHS